MRQMGLSERQTDAAHRLGQDVCVVAGPGSGKTSVLIERFSWLVRERGVSPRRILAITFTEKAATEIRQRMIRAFEGDLRMRQEIERAWVSTIHAFCARLLRENAIEAAIDPSFTVLEQSKLALQEAADQALESMYKDSPGSVRTFLRSLAVATEREGYVPDLASSLIEIYQAIRLAGTPAQNLLRPPVKRPDLFARMQTIAQEVAAERTPTRSPNQAQVHASAHDWCREVLALGCDEVTEAHLRSAQRENWNKHHMVKRSVAHRHEDELRALCAEAHRDFLLHYYARERAMIAEAIGRIDRLYRKRKRGSSMLDFDDLEEAAILLLENDLKLRERIRATFDYVLMDELQDTNPLQWRLMELVRREDRFFAVGDINQSIYGFRHARPDLYGNYRRGLEKAGLAVDELRDNYRSRPDLLETINRIFAGAPGIEPHELIAGRPFAEKPSGSVEFIAAFAENTADAERIEALWVAKRIVEIVGQLPLSGGPAKFGDIAILTRANYSTAELQLALDKFGVPSVVVGGLTFFDTREVRDLSLLLSVLVNPRNEVALAGLLRSPMFGMSDEDLLR
ncbi:MAG: UvrD-helicase domain-containing protein, partial [Bryobacteraceae bacterium]|nr:UvrD-helicase domain-containing protein [Bryobacteraceae bacterium]